MGCGMRGQRSRHQVALNLARIALPLLDGPTRGRRFRICDAIHAGSECLHLLLKQFLFALLCGQLPLEIADLVCGTLICSLEIFNRLLERRQCLL